MKKQFKTVKDIVGPLAFVELPKGEAVAYEELVEITTNDGKVRLGKVLESQEGLAVVQLFESPQGAATKDAKAKFMKEITVEGADLAFAIGPKILKEFDKKEFPLLLSMIECICNNEKLKIDWK